MLIKWVQRQLDDKYSEQLPVLYQVYTTFLVSNSNALFLQDAAEKRTVIMNRKATRKLQLLDRNVGNTAAVRRLGATRKPTAVKERRAVAVM